MNFNEMMVFVREQADTDSIDATDSKLEFYARAAYNDIRRRVPAWTDNVVTETLTVVAGTDGYSLSGGQFSGGNLEYVTGVVGPTDKLTYLPYPSFEHVRNTDDVQYSTREATHWSVKNDQLFLWPEPSDATVTYDVTGYRVFTDWPNGSTSIPDLPREFDEPICWYMLSKYHLGQEDIELAQMYMNTYEVMVNRMIAATNRDARPRPRVFGGASRRMHPTYKDWVKRNVEGI